MLPATDATNCIERLQLKKLGECTIVVRFIRHSGRENIPESARTRFARQREFIVSKRNCVYAESEPLIPVIPGAGAVAIASEMFVKGGSALASILHHVNPPRHERLGFEGPQDMVRYLRLMLELGFGYAAICVDCPTDLTVCPGHLRDFLDFFTSAERRRISIVVRKAGQLNTCATFNAAELLLALTSRQAIVDDSLHVTWFFARMLDGRNMTLRLDPNSLLMVRSRLHRSTNLPLDDYVLLHEHTWRQCVDIDPIQRA